MAEQTPAQRALAILQEAAGHVAALEILARSLMDLTEEDRTLRPHAYAVGTVGVLERQSEQLDAAIDELESSLAGRQSRRVVRLEQAEREYVRTSEARRDRENRWAHDHNWTVTKPPEKAKA